MKFRIIIMCILIGPLLCFSQRKEYNNALYKGSPNAFVTFLEKYPEGKFAEKAKIQKIHACNRWFSNISRSTEKDLEYFTVHCSEADSIENIKNVLYEMRWKRATSDNTIQGYKNFQKFYPAINKEKISKKIEDLSFKNALSQDTKKAYSEFLEKFPGSRYMPTIDSLIIATSKYALPKAAKAGNIATLEQLLPHADKEMKSRAVMEAIRGALFTRLDVGYDANGNFIEASIRASRTPRNIYVAIIKKLLLAGAELNQFSYASFGSVEVKQGLANNALRNQVNERGYGEVLYRIGDTEDETLLPYGDGISAFDVVKIHKASDIIILLENVPKATLKNFDFMKNRIGIFFRGMTVSDMHQLVPAKQIKKNQGYGEFGVELFDDYEISDANGKKLLILTPTPNATIDSKIDRVVVIDSRYKTSKGIGLNAAFGELKKHYTIKNIYPDLEDIVVEVESMNGWFAIKKTELLEGWWKDKRVDISKIPDTAKISDITIWWE